jgi:predicted enzyme related to lactoylglutathione lyase
VIDATTTAGFGLALDCADPLLMAEFWSAALGYRAIGSVGRVGSAGHYTALVPESGSGPKLLLQWVPEAKSSKNRMHIDIQTPDIDGLASRLVGLGATMLHAEPCHEHGATWLLMADPEGNEFCVCLAREVGEKTTP